MLVDSISIMGEKQVEKEEVEHADKDKDLSGKKLYVKLRSDQFTWLRKLFQMFPGEDRAIIYFSDTEQKKGATCILHTALIEELRERLGEKNVVLK